MFVGCAFLTLEMLNHSIPSLLNMKPAFLLQSGLQRWQCHQAICTSHTQQIAAADVPVPIQVPLHLTAHLQRPRHLHLFEVVRRLLHALHRALHRLLHMRGHNDGLRGAEALGCHCTDHWIP